MTESRKLANAKGLYFEGIRDGNVEDALNKYIGDRYTQHSTGVKDGKEGFIDFFKPFLKRNPIRDIRVVRGLVDGNYVFIHAYQNLNNGGAEWVTADLFDTDQNDKIVEHWDCIQEFVGETASGRSMVDGFAEVVDLDKTDENKKLVREFCDQVLINGNTDSITDFISENEYIQHSPKVKDGLAGFGEFVATLVKQGLAMKYLKVHKLIGQGNFVVTLSHMLLADDEYAVFDIFRLDNGKIVEHWDVMEQITPKEQWVNSGKF